MIITMINKPKSYRSGIDCNVFSWKYSTDMNSQHELKKIISCISFAKQISLRATNILDRYCKTK